MSFDLIAGNPEIQVVDAVVREMNGEVRLLNVGTQSLTALPTNFALEPNYPNPFNPQTTIRYQLPESAKVRLVIYDILGQEVRTLLDEVQRSGYHRVIWDGRSDVGYEVASGVYFYRLQAGSFSAVRKLVLIQ